MLGCYCVRVRVSTHWAIRVRVWTCWAVTGLGFGHVGLLRVGLLGLGVEQLGFGHVGRLGFGQW